MTRDISDDVGWACLGWACPLNSSVPVERRTIWKAAWFTSLLNRFGMVTVCHGSGREEIAVDSQSSPLPGDAPSLVRQFDSVGVSLIALMLFGKDLFQPLCLPFRNQLIHRYGIVADEKLLAATVTP
jgi:hypothetical protein